ncbi:uncharacterized protein SETTUDRAFT_25804 [Exserohilum turcica Et28A]|uniref:Protein kinase domain-containing protein n=1 Tax=Exserohilum turcicum (strain 28A) TaxID=671987 RepID=R0J191_EXST2|nr:uncharacterized protein SETTUDRAFT_25804 [Exserohilum turcica Et28A]EOA90541.1 hypothetical protein SETTUDRAFT_25804 [Exserohilum turcica Et28A]
MSIESIDKYVLDEIVEACADTSDSAEELSKKLVNKIVAVKRSTGYFAPTLHNEVARMKAIGESVEATGNTQSQFFQLLAYDIDDTSVAWMATSTFPICLSLEGFRSLGEMPEDFLWVCFTQLQQGLEFLHGVCDPTIVHCDLHLGNIVVGFPDAVPSGLPQVKIVDFGVAVLLHNDTQETAVLAEDNVAFLELLHSLIHKWDGATCGDCADATAPEPGEQSMIGKFHDDIVKQLEYGSGGFARIRVGLWERFGDFATMRGAAVSKASEQNMQGVIMDDFGSQKREMEARLEEIIRERVQPLSQ